MLKPIFKIIFSNYGTLQILAILELPDKNLGLPSSLQN